MHVTQPHAITAAPTAPAGPWWRELSRYHWFVLVVASLGWLFDTMDQQLFTIARRPAMLKLLEPAPGEAPPKEKVDEYSGYTTAIFLIGWGTGGILFGILGDIIATEAGADADLIRRLDVHTTLAGASRQASPSASTCKVA